VKAAGRGMFGTLGRLSLPPCPSPVDPVVVGNKVEMVLVKTEMGRAEAALTMSATVEVDDGTSDLSGMMDLADAVAVTVTSIVQIVVATTTLVWPAVWALVFVERGCAVSVAALTIVVFEDFDRAAVCVFDVTLDDIDNVVDLIVAADVVAPLLADEIGAAPLKGMVFCLRETAPLYNVGPGIW